MADKNAVEVALKIQTESFETGVKNARISFVDASHAMVNSAKPSSEAVDKMGKKVKGMAAESQKAVFVINTLNRSLLSGAAASKKRQAAATRLAAKTRINTEANKAAAASSALLTNKVIALGVAYLSISRSINLVKTLLNTGGDFEALRVSLDNLTGSAEGGEEAFKWIEDFTKNTPFGLEQVTKSFIKLKAFGLDPMDGTYQAIADQVSSVAGGQEHLNGIVIALGQAWAKQKLQGEEILQLIERQVPVWKLLSQATGKSTLELNKLSEQGKLGRDVIKLLIDEMGRGVKGAALKQVEKWNGLVSNATDEWAKFLNLIAESGALEFFSNEIRKLLKEVARLKETKELQLYAQEVSDAIVSLAKNLKAAGELISSLGTAAEVLIKVAVVSKLLSWATAMYTVAAASNAAALATTAAAVSLKLLKAVATFGLTVVLDAVISSFFGVDEAAESAAKSIEKSAEKIKKAQRKIREEAEKKISDKAQKALKQAAEEQLDFSTKIANAKQSETKAIKTELDKQLRAYDKHLSGLKNAQQEQIDIAKEFADFTNNLGASSGVDNPDILDFASAITNARKALNEGDYDGAIDGARGLADMIRTMRDNGTEADIVLTGLAQQAEKLANDAASQRVDNEAVKLKSAEATITSLTEKAAFLKNIELGFSQELAAQNLQEIQQILQQKLTSNPLVMAVQFGQTPDLKNAQKFLDKNGAGSSLIPNIPELPTNQAPIKSELQLDTTQAEAKLAALTEKAAAPVTKKIFISDDGRSFSDTGSGVAATFRGEALKKGSRT